MGRPSKSVAQLKHEGKSHRTKAELEHREEQEKAFLTGEPIREAEFVAVDGVAHEMFARVTYLLGIIGKDDALQENVVNRYCILHSEAMQLMGLRGELEEEINKYREKIMRAVTGKMKPENLAKVQVAFESALKLLIASERQLKSKRDMLFRIERESLMTAAAAMRAIPKRPPEDDGDGEGMFG